VRQVLLPDIVGRSFLSLCGDTGADAPAFRSRKGGAVRRLIRAVGARLLFLPPYSYSPDLNPIEQVFAKLKTLLRKAEERTTEGVSTRIGRLLEGFSPAECASYLRNAASI
jgi:transposase